MTTLNDILFDRVAWQTILDTERQVFQPLQPGAAIGFLPKWEFERQDGSMMVWVRGSGGMSVEYRPFSGFSEAGVDILFVAEEGAIQQMIAYAGDQPLTVIRQQIRHGKILFYALKSNLDLEDLGLADFVDSVGIPFLGACR